MPNVERGVSHISWTWPRRWRHQTTTCCELILWPYHSKPNSLGDTKNAQIQEWIKASRGYQICLSGGTMILIGFGTPNLPNSFHMFHCSTISNASCSGSVLVEITKFIRIPRSPNKSIFNSLGAPVEIPWTESPLSNKCDFKLKTIW